MERIFIHIYRFFRKRKVLLYTVLAVTTAVFLFFGLQVRYEEDISELLPQTDAATERGLAFGDLKVKDKIFLLFHPVGEEEEGFAGIEPSILASYTDDFFGNLLEKDKHTGYIDNILYRIDDDLAVMGLDYVLSHVPSFIDDSCYTVFDSLITPEAIKTGMEKNAALVASDEDGSLSTMVGYDPLSLRSALTDKGRELKDGLGGYAVIDGHLFTPDSTTALGFLAPGFKSFDSKSGTRLIEMLESEIQEFNGKHSDVEVLFHGAPVQSVFNSRKIKSDLLLTIGISLAVICILLGICMRGKSTLPILLFPVAYGTIFSLACIWFIKGSISLMAMGIGAIVLGVALSYSLHVITHYKYVTSPEQVIREQTTPVCLGCITTIGAFAGLLFTESELLRDFGIFASLAMTGTTLASLIFVPHMFIPSRNRKSEQAFAILDKINAYPYDRNKFLVTAILAVFAVSLFTSRKVVFDSDLKNIGYNNPEVMRAKELYERKNNGGLISMYFASAADRLDTAIENNAGIVSVLDSLRNEGLVSSFSKVSELLVSTAEQERRIEKWNDYWSADRLSSVRKDISRYADASGLDPDMFEPFFIMTECGYEPESIYEAGIIPDNLMCNYVEESEDKFMVFTSVKMDESAKQTVCREVAARPGAVVIDPFFYTNDMVEVIHNDFNMILGISSAFVFLVLLLSFRNFWIALIAFLPMSMSWIIVQGIMQMAGIEFNLINIVISTFIFGIGVDYSIFIMDGLTSGRHGGNRELLQYHKTAILFSATVLIVVVGSLVFAGHPAIRSIGVTTLIGMTSTILITYAIEPLLYRVYLRIGKKKERI